MSTVGIYVGDSTDPIGNISASLEPFVRHLSDVGHTVELFGGATPVSEINCHQFSTDIPKYKTTLGKINAARNVCSSYCRKRKPDAILQFWQFSLHAPAVIAAGEVTGTPTAVRLNGDIFNQYQHYDGGLRYLARAFDYTAGMSMRLADAVLVFGPYGSQQAHHAGVSNDRIWTLPPSRAIGKRFSPPDSKSERKAQFGFPTDQTIALYVGRIEDAKGMDFLIDVISQVDAGSVQFLLVGGGPGESEDIDHEIARRFSNETVRIEGKVPHRKIHEYYQAADVYIHPSRFEGIPLTAIEARNCALPVIARQAGDLGMVTTDIVHSPDEMAQKLQRKDWSDDWGAETPFSEDYQRDTLGAMIKSISK